MANARGKNIKFGLEHPEDPEKDQEKGEEEKLGQTDLSNVNARDFNFLSFEEIYNRLHNI